MKTLPGTHQVYASRAEHTPDLYKHTPSLYKHILGLYKHPLDLQKSCRVHPRSLQAALRPPQVYTSTHQIYIRRAWYILILYKPCRAHPRPIKLYQAHPRSIQAGQVHPMSIQSVSCTPQFYTNRPQVYTSHAKHATGLYIF